MSKVTLTDSQKNDVIEQYVEVCSAPCKQLELDLLDDGNV